MSGLTRREVMPVTAGSTTVTVGIAGTHQESGPIAAELIRVVGTSACFLDFGVSPVATTGKLYLPAGVPEYFSWVPNDKVSALQAVGAGTLYVSY